MASSEKSPTRKSARLSTKLSKARVAAASMTRAKTTNLAPKKATPDSSRRKKTTGDLPSLGQSNPELAKVAKVPDISMLRRRSIFNEARKIVVGESTCSDLQNILEKSPSMREDDESGSDSDSGGFSDDEEQEPSVQVKAPPPRHSLRRVSHLVHASIKNTNRIGFILESMSESSCPEEELGEHTPARPRARTAEEKQAEKDVAIKRINQIEEDAQRKKLAYEQMNKLQAVCRDLSQVRKSLDGTEIEMSIGEVHKLMASLEELMSQFNDSRDSQMISLLSTNLNRYKQDLPLLQEKLESAKVFKQVKRLSSTVEAFVKGPGEDGENVSAPAWVGRGSLRGRLSMQSPDLPSRSATPDIQNTLPPNLRDTPTPSLEDASTRRDNDCVAEVPDPIVAESVLAKVATHRGAADFGKWSKISVPSICSEPPCDLDQRSQKQFGWLSKFQSKQFPQDQCIKCLNFSRAQTQWAAKTCTVMPINPILPARATVEAVLSWREKHGMRDRCVNNRFEDSWSRYGQAGGYEFGWVCYCEQCWRPVPPKSTTASRQQASLLLQESLKEQLSSRSA